MAKSTITVITSDISGDKAEETLTFGLSGRHYSIDLTTAEANELRAVLGPYVESAEGLKLKEVREHYQEPGKAKGKPETPKDRAHMREWAKENGYSIGDRGRISEDIRKAYKAAH